MRKAVERRAEALRALGIDPADPARQGKLRELERRGLGERFASREGLTFVPDTPETFQGRVQLIDRGADGAPYAAVTDRTRVVVMPASPDLRARDGQLVALKRGRDGKVWAREPEKDRDR